MRLLVFICVFTLVHFVASEPIKNSNDRSDIYTVSVQDNHTICEDEVTKVWTADFHNCFIDRKYKDGGRDLNNIVDRILDHSKDCIQKSTKECKLDYKGFTDIMSEIIREVKDYCYIYLESIIHDRHKVKDLECVEKVLSVQTYKNCFQTVLSKDYKPEEFKKEVEKAISCANIFNKKCSKTAKTSLNRMVRNILRVKQPATENIEDDPVPKPPKQWYEYLYQPFVSLWNSIRSFFGF